jgi:hypothetical protein
MSSVESCITYSVSVFIIILITGCILNLLKKHFIMQLAGITFFFVYFFSKCIFILNKYNSMDNIQFYQTFLIAIAGITACLASMVLGFWLFPRIRKKFIN